MVKKSRKDGRDIYLCEVCGFGYETAWLNLQPTHGEEASPPPSYEQTCCSDGTHKN